ncbi:hypothetical protein [Nocardia iowensis]|uniref:Uncharacterized protein n=1 Tax=Nocardia iowensis TaxID=204891 RepID=A0ABX8RZH3_NOCIO|nr:hypothetical protein [Nocardia iowensis]QXN94661.1 hypothetical protein KV110_17365 [Nocardia iowensis]
MTEDHPLARRLDDGRILLRFCATDPGGALVDGAIVIGPADPDFAHWEAAIKRWVQRNPQPEPVEYEPIDYQNMQMFPGDRS